VKHYTRIDRTDWWVERGSRTRACVEPMDEGECLEPCVSDRRKNQRISSRKSLTSELLDEVDLISRTCAMHISSIVEAPESSSAMSMTTLEPAGVSMRVVIQR
jgi:hypothetical protein